MGKIQMLADQPIAVLDRIAAGGREPVRAGMPNPWPIQVVSPLVNADARSNEIDAENVAEAAAMRRLVDILLAFGGHFVCLPPIEEDLSKILSRGQLWPGKGAKRMPGLPIQCHFNAARCWEANADKALLATGYALSRDGLWRQHSWVVHVRPRSAQIVETTERRELYFGFVMNQDESDQFHFENE